MRPLHAEGVETFEVREGTRAVEKITREDLPAFEVPDAPERQINDVDPERTVALEVIKPSFQETLTWVFSDGSGGRINALMQDRNFLARVQAGRTFAKGDVLRVRMRTRSYLTAEGLRAENTVVEVLEEIDQPRQHQMLPIPRFPRPLPLTEPKKKQFKRIGSGGSKARKKKRN